MIHGQVLKYHAQITFKWFGWGKVGHILKERGKERESKCVKILKIHVSFR